MLRKRILLPIILVIVFSLPACGVAEVTFPDPNLESAIREAIDNPDGPILKSNLEGLTTLVVEERGIANVNGLEHCGNLAVLSLRGNQISDISSLACLTNLAGLELGGNQISNVSPLASLTQLTELYLNGNQISDISSLASLTNLAEVYLVENPLSSASIEVHIPQLEERRVMVRFEPTSTLPQSPTQTPVKAKIVKVYGTPT